MIDELDIRSAPHDGIKSMDRGGNREIGGSFFPQTLTIQR